MYFLSLVLIFLISDPVQAQESPPARESVPTFAIFPFHSPHDPDYGVFMADRLMAELMYHRDVPAWQGRRFELTEPDTLNPGRIQRFLNVRRTLEGPDLETLRKAAGADLALIGSVSDAGIRTLHLKIFDLATGEIRWKGNARDDIKWVWIYAKRQIGDIVMADIMSKLGYLEFDRRPPTLRSEEVPKKTA